MKGTWMLLVSAILLLFGPEGPFSAGCRMEIIDHAAEAESGVNDRILLILLLCGVMHAAWHWDKKRRSHEA